MQLDAVGDGQAMPAKRQVVVVRDCFVSAGVERWCQGQRDLSLEGVTGDVAHLGANGVQALPFPLANLDCEKLEQMAIAVGRAGAGAFRSVE